MPNAPTAAQSRAITSDSKQILVVAGAGAGKTGIIVQRILRLIEEGADLKSICVITYTNAAANELAHRLGVVAKSLGYIGTLHGLVLILFKTYGAEFGFPTYTLIDEQQREEMILEAIASMKYKGSRKAVNAALKDGVGQNGRDPALLVANSYWQTLARNTLADFDTILFHGTRLVDELRAKGKELFRFLFVDEYQDSGFYDEVIISAFPVGNRFIVGDPDQAIYGFRGGRVGNILKMANSAAYEVVRLDDNFRCAPAICEVANRLIGHNTKRVDKRTVSAVKGTPGKVEMWDAVPDPTQEIQMIADDIMRTSTDAAVLCPTNRAAEFAAGVLRGRGLEVAMKEKNNDPADWREARLLVQIAANPMNNFLVGRYMQRTMTSLEIARRQQQAIEASQPFYQTLGVFAGLQNMNFLNELLPWLSRMGVSFESCERMEGLMRELPDNATLPDLCVSIAEAYHQRQEDGTGIVVTTYHGFKGRERETIYCPGFEAQVLPGRREDTDVEEKRRVAYVAFTRAKSRLVVSYCAKRTPHQHTTKLEPVEPSPFLEEAGLLERVTEWKKTAAV